MRIKPSEMASVAQAGLMSDIKEQELRIEMKHHAGQAKEEESKPARINRFERNETDLATYQKKIQELQDAEKGKRVQEEYEAFRRSMNTTAMSRTRPKTQRISAEEKFYRRLLDQYEPISKERAKDMLEKIDEGIKRVDAKVDEKPFVEQFADYSESYKQFMDDLLTYHGNRMEQGKALQDIHIMADIVGQGM